VQERCQSLQATPGNLQIANRPECPGSHRSVMNRTWKINVN
jgi:hypothetical protein